MNSSKNKGSRFERLIVKTCELHDIPARRAYASDGRALGCHSEVDVLINDDIKVTVEDVELVVKENVDVQIVKQDRGATMVIMEINDFLLMYKKGLK